MPPADRSPTDVTYGELRDDSTRFAAALAGLGMGPGDRVATLMGKSRNYLVALLGIWRLGAVHVPLFSAFAPPAISFRLLGSEAKILSATQVSGRSCAQATGDTAMVDEEGYFTFSARDDDVIIMAGYRIGPFEVESTLATHPVVAESAVIAVPDTVRGEVIEVYAVLRDGFLPSPGLEGELQQRVKQRFAAHAYPRAVHFVEAMPKTPSGKIQRFLLKQRRLDELAGVRQ